MSSSNTVKKKNVKYNQLPVILDWCPLMENKCHVHWEDTVIVNFEK